MIIKKIERTWNEWKHTVYLSLLLMTIGGLTLSFRGDIPTLMILLLSSPLLALGVWSVVNWVVIIISFFLDEKKEREGRE